MGVGKRAKIELQRTEKQAMRQDQITIPLGIPDIKVLETAVNERGEIIITIESTKGGTRCRKCGKWITKAHGQDDWVTIRHLPAFGQQSYLRYRPKRYQCQDCEGHPTTTQTLEWHESNSPHSYAYDNHILLQLTHSTIADVCAKEGLSYSSVAGTLERRIDKRVNWSELEEIETLGLDEISLKKGRKHFVTLVTARLLSGEIIILAVWLDAKKGRSLTFFAQFRRDCSKPSKRFVAICGKGIQKRRGRRLRTPVWWQTVFTLPNTITPLQTTSASKN